MKVHVVNSATRHAYEPALREMHRHRHRIFVQTLGWRAMSCADGIERDAFDTADATYLLVLDDAGVVRGSARFLPTMGPHLLNGPLRDFIAGEPLTGSEIVEWSRHAPGDPSWPPDINADARITLNLGAMEWALLNGVAAFVAVLETWLLPRAKAFGWTCTPLGPQRAYGEGEAVAVHIPIETDTLQTMRRKFDRPHTLLARASERAA